MAAGLVGSDAYTEAFTWSTPIEIESEASVDVIAQAKVAEIEAQFVEIDWLATAAKARPSRV
jgi:hypothetical protein